MDRETALRQAQESSLGGQPRCNGGSVREEREFRRRRKAAEISKIPMGNLRAGAPTPPASHDGMHFDSGCHAAHVQVRQRRGLLKKITPQIPIFLPRVTETTLSHTLVSVIR